MVCEKEGLTCTEEVYNVVSKVSGGDLRKAITFIQGVSRLTGGEIDPQAVIDMAGAVPDDEIKELLNTLRTDNYEKMAQAVGDILAQGFSGNAVFAQLLEAIVDDKEFSDMHKAQASIKMAECEKKLADGASERLQLLDVCSTIQCVFANMEQLPGEVA